MLHTRLMKLLNKCAAISHVHFLEPSTHAEHRHPCLDCGGPESQGQVVARSINLSTGWAWGAVIMMGVGIPRSD